MTTPNWKSIIHEYATQSVKQLPVVYKNRRVGGPDHVPDFLCILNVGSMETRAHGNSIQNAEKTAARIAVGKLKIYVPVLDDEIPPLEEAPQSSSYEGAYVFPQQSIWSREAEYPKTVRSEAMYETYRPACHNYILQVNSGKNSAKPRVQLPSYVQCVGIMNDQMQPVKDLENLPKWIIVVKNKNFFINMMFFHLGKFAATNESVTLVSPIISSMPKLCKLLLEAYSSLTIATTAPEFAFE